MKVLLIINNVDIIPFSDHRYQELEDMLETDSSKQILSNIRRFRGNNKVSLVPVAQLLGYSNGEDYWGTVKPFRRFGGATLAICVYHKENDIIEIPLYLKLLVPEYKLYLSGGSHTTCIAQIEE